MTKNVIYVFDQIHREEGESDESWKARIKDLLKRYNEAEKKEKKKRSKCFGDCDQCDDEYCPAKDMEESS